MAVKRIFNIIFLLIILVTSLPVKQASQIFFKKQVQEEMNDDCCDVPLKKCDNDIGFKEFPCCYHHRIVIHPLSQALPYHVCHANWRLPLCPAVEIHTPPPNLA